MSSDKRFDGLPTHESLRSAMDRVSFRPRNYSAMLTRECVESKRIEFGYPSGVDVTSLGFSKGLFLTPSSMHRKVVPSFSPLGSRIESKEARRWRETLSFRGLHNTCPLRIQWTQLVLNTHAQALHNAGIYGAVYCSLFSYKPSINVMMAFLENWNSSTHSVILKGGEIGISLWDLKHIAGLPIAGESYDEYNPAQPDPDLQLVYDYYLRLALDEENNLHSVSGTIIASLP